MSYKVKLSHINPDFSFQPPPVVDWSDEIADDPGLVFLMNRVAVAASQEVLVDFPEIEITKGSQRVTVTAVSGQLVYNDTHTTSCQNLKVIPDEVIRLLEGKPLHEVFLSAEDESLEAPVVRYKKSKVARLFKVMALAIMVGSLFWLGYVINREFGTRETLIRTPQFIPVTDGSAEVLKKYHGVYVNEIKEGGLVFELLASGQLDIYEMWHSKRRQEYMLVLTQSLPLLVGLHDNKLAMLAGEFHLVQLKDDDTLQLYNWNYYRQNGPLNVLGEVVKAEDVR